MATHTPLPAGPIPFEDVEAVLVTPVPEELPPEKHDDLVSALPAKTSGDRKLRCYQGFWLPEMWVPAAVALQRRFEPRPDDVILASTFKCGTTWLISLAFATMARRAHPPGAADHPLRRLNPHQCVPFLEGLFAAGQERKLDALPSPRLMNTHMPLAMIPPAAAAAGGCRVVYVCREPKDMVVSLWHYLRRLWPEMPLRDVVENACDGATACGPFWDHFLGYWRASLARPDGVLFLRYEELLRDPAGSVRRLARFVGQPFTAAEEEAGVVAGIVQLCSLESLRGVEANRTEYMNPHFKVPRDALFRKGVAGDWASQMTPEMARRLDDIVADKFRGTGLTFQ